MNENKEKNTNRPKNKGNGMVTHAIIAEAADVPVNTVKAIRNGKRSKDTETGEKVTIAEILIEDGINKLIEEVKRIVRFKK